MKNDKIDESKKKCSTSENIEQNKRSIGLERFSYADFVILASTLAYAVFEELTDTDVDILLSFVSMFSSDLALLRTQRGVQLRLQAAEEAANQATEEDSDLEGAIIDDELINQTVNAEIITDDIANLSRKKRYKNKKKYIKKRKKR